MGVGRLRIVVSTFHQVALGRNRNQIGEPGGVSPMALTLRVRFGSGVFGLSFFELGGLMASGVDFAVERAAGAMREFVLRRDGQGFAVLVSPTGGVGVPRRAEEHADGGPSSF